MSGNPNLSATEALQIRVEVLEQTNEMFQDLLVWVICESIKAGNSRPEGFNNFIEELRRRHPDSEAELGYLSDVVNGTLAHHGYRLGG
ncbi:hypothetical protein [Neisseria shayeganii]|uniref:Uncharacterized protein n=1 Tax=Neisseria shayeganii TaxID=607712 RepID=A0A7D7N6J7_9NEIS|nr:hypothetical protein [Neisseria shayeganii]QMT39961.1 hypothetical protein H3L94_08880 [Neisseria shayeganii]